MKRRDFLKGGALIAAAFGCGVSGCKSSSSERPHTHGQEGAHSAGDAAEGSSTNTDRIHDKGLQDEGVRLDHEKDMEAKIEEGIRVLKEQILEGIEEAERSSSGIDAYDEVLDRIADLDAKQAWGKEEYEKLCRERDRLHKETDRAKRYRLGNIRSMNDADEIESARALLDDQEALRNVVRLQLFMREKGGDFEYIHNYADGYLAVGTLHVDEKMNLLASLSTAELKDMSKEDLFYVLFTESFDAHYDAAELKDDLDTHCVRWNKTPAVNSPKRYNHNNDPTVFSLVERNRMKLLIERLQDKAFLKSIFDLRQKDLHTYYSEIGGVVPTRGRVIVEQKPAQETSNHSYFPPNRGTTGIPKFLANFHFHAARVDHGHRMGPSGGDIGVATASVVFTSLNEKEISIHFYVSRLQTDDDWGYNKMDVISLGVIDSSSLKE